MPLVEAEAQASVQKIAFKIFFYIYMYKKGSAFAEPFFCPIAQLLLFSFDLCAAGHADRASLDFADLVLLHVF